MDIDTETIIKLISPNGIPDSWKDNPDFYSYLSKLGNYSVEQLSKEPDHLNTEKAAILNQTQELAFANYKTFIRTAECSREIFQQFNNTEERLDSLLNKMPELSERCEEFVKCCEEIRVRRRVNTVCLTRHSAVLQALEVPQLMDTVIRESMYEEALQLAAYVRRLAKTHSNIPIICSIADDVERCWRTLMQKLVSQLGSELQLPKCLQLVGHLRRMNVLSEMELRLKFLQARDTWLQSQLSAVPTDDASQHLSKTIELSRTHLFNIITQYKAVFTDDEAVLHSSRPKFNELPVLQSWINEKVKQFVDTVQADLNRGVGANLASLLGQSMYFGQSLSRVGADMRAAIAPIFIRTITNNLTLSLKAATAAFTSDMDKFTLSNAFPHSKLPFEEAQTTDKMLSDKAVSTAPPNWLLEFYPLSNCCNNITTALNELRLCAPLCLASTVTALLTDTLTSVSEDINMFYKREQQAMVKEERECLSRLCVCFADHFVPYIQRCLHQIYSPLEIASFLGILPNKLQTEGLVYLNDATIFAPISHLLPPKLESFNVLSSEVSIHKKEEEKNEEKGEIDSVEDTNVNTQVKSEE